MNEGTGLPDQSTSAGSDHKAAGMSRKDKDDMNKRVLIAGRLFDVEGDPSDYYFKGKGSVFEADLVSLFTALCEEDFQAIDVGANIGLTALALAQICQRGKVAAVEPLPETFQFLKRNAQRSNFEHLSVHQFAAAATEKEVPMERSATNSSGTFVSDLQQAPVEGHLRYHIKARPLDRAFAELGLDRLDFLKIDVEGYELEVFAGARALLAKYKPLVVMEMSHWCLNVFRRICLPDFLESLACVFPALFAVDQHEFIDMSTRDTWYHVMYQHITRSRYCNLVAGFDRDVIATKLSQWEHSSSGLGPAESIKHDSDKVIFQHWSYAEPTHRWSLGNESSIIFTASDKSSFIGKLVLHIGTLGRQTLIASLNGVELGRKVVDSRDSVVKFKFDPGTLRHDKNNELTFSFPDARSPGTGDNRILALALRSFKFM